MTKALPANKAKLPPLVLAVLDGWGIAPSGPGNAIDLARTPSLDAFAERFPHARLEASGRYVGLLPSQEGNSEAGHMNIGAGRNVRQDIVYVTEAIKDRTFFKNPALREACSHARNRGGRVHVLGLLSNGNSAHSSPFHLYSLLEMLAQENMHGVRLHLFTDGRDSPPYAATHLLHELERHLRPEQKIASVMGRFYAMDRNRRWLRTQLAYDAIIHGKGVAAATAHAAILHGYGRGEADEFIIPTVMVDEKHRPIGTVGDGDSVIFFNLRSDRARQITKAFVQQDFETRNEGAFVRESPPKDTTFVAMTDFGPDLPGVLGAYPSHDVVMGLTETLAPLRQFYIAESEKFAHVTYFFNGGYAQQLRGEERMRVPSAFVPHHDMKPEMRAKAITDEVIRRLKTGLHDFICINYANADMVAHTGNLRATVAAVETVDACMGRLAKACDAAGGCLVICGDHGNAEVMINEETGEVFTEHTVNPVPFHLVGRRYRGSKVGDGTLGDVAPSILDIMDMPKPVEMSGFSLLR